MCLWIKPLGGCTRREAMVVGMEEEDSIMVLPVLVAF